MKFSPWISDRPSRLVLVAASSLFLLAATSSPTMPGADVMQSLLETQAHSAEADSFYTETAADAEINAMILAETPAYVTMPVEAPATLSVLVEALETPQAHVREDDQLMCLARAVYFEARGEPLEGQLAVAQAILNRVESGRYPNSVCGVVRQPGQFTYSHSQQVKMGDVWRRAQAIAVVAAEGMWQEVAPDAMSFHATYVRPVWRNKVRVAQIGRHVFYR